MKNPKIKKYFFYYLKENILIFDVSSYIDELAVYVIDFFFEWGLLKKIDNQPLINTNPKLIKELLETKIKNEIEDLQKIGKENNCRVLSFFYITSQVKPWYEYFADYLKFIKTCKKLCKKNLPNFYETKNNQPLFLTKKGTFLDFSCIIPSGNDEEFIFKALDKLKK